MESTGGEARRKQLVRQLATSIDIEDDPEPDFSDSIIPLPGISLQEKRHLIQQQQSSLPTKPAVHRVVPRQASVASYPFHSRVTLMRENSGSMLDIPGFLGTSLDIATVPFSSAQRFVATSTPVSANAAGRQRLRIDLTKGWTSFLENDFTTKD
ncbi:uncharacterized protein LOC111699531 isoform X2 [Eurytemora carolleeae]|uniref:uncharacterized protein LOC111699531 isoform X2 n=1 Tax=Eurytemora carolleeae TaxID=1294199 RepID=UPI000C77CAB6|nr:uncharacterized protein LOC111699531 isoform X2 [Eurytemora carolleeae]|eukprot:XP_023325992.1 uncharacterized protein LOC111699531 isoform X2 [Eurytemora affinis]